MSLLQFCQWLKETPISVSLRESTWDYPVIGFIHLLGIAVFGGMMVMGNMRLLGVWMPGERVSEVLTRFRPWKWIGFFTVAVTGSLLALSEPVVCYKSRTSKNRILSIICETAAPGEVVGGNGWVTVLGMSPLGQQIRSLTVAAPTGLPYVCSRLQNRDRSTWSKYSWGAMDDGESRVAAR